MKGASPYFALPLDDLRRTVRSVTHGARTLGGLQLASEIEELRAICAGRPDDLAARLVARLYADESARRVDPLHQFDDELDKVLGRLERTTTPEDRQRVTDIGLELHRLGGVDALRSVHRRMMERGDTQRRHVRDGIMAKRWDSIAPWRVAA